jgi:hypothetical protein
MILSIFSRTDIIFIFLSVQSIIFPLYSSIRRFKSLQSLIKLNSFFFTLKTTPFKLFKLAPIIPPTAPPEP